MRKWIILTAAILILGSIPATTAEHLSAGVQDGVGLTPEETPNDRSVDGTEVGANDTPYGVATKEGCFSPNGTISTQDSPQRSVEDSVQNAQKSAEDDGLCGELVYHEDTNLTVISAPDQDLRGDEIGGFDVIHAQSYRTMTYTGVAADIGGFSYCAPMCPSDSTLQPEGGDVVFDTFHNAGAQLGLTENAKDARSNAPEDRGQHYAVNTYAQGPGRVAQDQANVWRMNGWMMPAYEDTFIGYLYDKQGEFIGQEELSNIVSSRQENGTLDDSAKDRICAFSPNLQLTTVASGAAGFSCELPFRYRGPGDGEANFKDGYDDRCDSPAYVCGAFNGPAWYAEFCICWGGALSGNGYDHYIWHHFVAPTPSDCGGALEPNVAFEGDTSGELPYLGHDVDIYTPPTSVRGADDLRGVSTVEDYARAVEVETTDLPSIPDTDEAPEALPSEINKEQRVEPNNAQSVGGLDDTSQSKESGDDLVRSFADPCEAFTSDETEATIDPWVDYIDNHARAVQDLSPCIPIGSCNPIANVELDAYANDDETQDSSNRPGPSLYGTQGNVGMFTDKNDNGEYETLPGGEKYNLDAIKSEGAYPMMWDMALTESGDVNRNGGCQPSGEIPLPAAMEDLGYGPNTGLVEAVYLKEPTAFVDAASGQSIPYADGHNIYLVMSQSARTQYEPGVQDANAIDSEIETLVSNLKTYAENENPNFGEPNVVVPGEQMGLSTGFERQCNGDTGNFDSRLQFVHDCSVDCSGDTIATMYTFQLTNSGGELFGANLLPDFRPTGSDLYEFGQGQHTWYDIDPFDNNPDRNRDAETTPPTG